MSLTEFSVPLLPKPQIEHFALTIILEDYAK